MLSCSGWTHPSKKQRRIFRSPKPPPHSAGPSRGASAPSRDTMDDFDSLRPLCYPNAAVLLLCFSVVCPTSFQNASQKWLPELRRHCPDAPIVLVGTQCDLRTDVKVLIELARYGEEPVPESAARHAAHRMGALAYVECSALTQKNLKEVFDTAIVAALRRNSPGLVGKGFNLLLPGRRRVQERHGTVRQRDDFDSLRPLCYPNAAVLLLCFSVVCPTSFQNASQKWLPELRRHCPDAPIVLVGTQCDLRTDVKVLIELARYGEEPVPESAARHAAHRMGALAYVECSALTQKNLKEVFDTAIVAALRRNSPGLVGKGFNLLPSRSSPGSRNGTGQFSNGFVPFPRRRAMSLDRRGARDYEGKKTGWKKLCCFI
ncbi:hypothetical protein HPB51_014979 [Rhipicephalus microplus]|uniref:Uncharacterized protein n=1 Tax=Rhipicephalus microplus TaxID=6941 RepID=A0A9J6E1E5_RHIMP|nr:hypothetical protein HPB51_014979 [Rhipicephalus microplus]